MMVDADLARLSAARRPVKLLVTGADGFVGRHLVRRLAPRRAPDRRRRAGRAGRRVDWDGADVTAAAAGAHRRRLGARRPWSSAPMRWSIWPRSPPTAKRRRDPGQAWTVNAGGHGAAGRGARPPAAAGTARHAAPGRLERRGLRAGRDARRGRETDPLAPATPYAASKAGAELAALEVWRRTGLPVIIARPFTHTGPGQDDALRAAGVRGAAARGQGERRAPGARPATSIRCGTCSTCATWWRRTSLLLGARRAGRGLQRGAGRGQLGAASCSDRLAELHRGPGRAGAGSGAGPARATSRTLSAIRPNCGAPPAGRRRAHWSRLCGDWWMPKRTDLETILLIGSGPIVIGQGAEFDYSGTQAVRALKEEGYRVVLVNSNPGDDHDRSRAGRPDLHRAGHARSGWPR